MNKNTALAGIVLLILLFLGVTVVADNVLGAARLDLTENNLYTLSPGSRAILRTLDEPITLTLFFSDSLTSGRPALGAYGKRVRELLEEYELRAGGNITLELLDPEPFSEAEDRARRAGIAGVPISEGERFYFGLVGTNSTDGRELIPFFDPSQERFLEYELSRLIHKLATDERPVVGLLSTLPLEGREPTPGMPPELSRPWSIMREIRSLFEVRNVAITATEIPDDIDLLLIIHPKGLADETLRAIDAYVTRGGATIVCIDPLCEQDIPPDAMQNPQAMLQADRSSDLDALMSAWGVLMDGQKVVVDIDHAMRGPSRRQAEMVAYVQYLSLDGEQVDPDDAVTGGLSRLAFASAGALTFDESRGTTWTPLVWSGERSAEVDAARLAFFPDPSEFVAGYVASGGSRTIAGRLTGPARSAFADAPDADPDDGDAPASLNVMVLSDCDFLADRWWVQEMRLGNMVLGYQKQSDNADLLINAMDNMAGSSDLITLRARGKFTRPFTLVEEIQRNAERQYLAEAKDLEEERRSVEARIRELQQERPDAGDLILTPEQEAEVQKFRDQLAETNAQLRGVRYNLRKDVEDLGLTLKVANTVLAPALVALGAVGLGAYRSFRRRRDQRTMAGQG